MILSKRRNGDGIDHPTEALQQVWGKTIPQTGAPERAGFPLPGRRDTEGRDTGRLANNMQARVVGDAGLGRDAPGLEDTARRDQGEGARSRLGTKEICL